jgi:hypothetical protein
LVYRDKKVVGVFVRFFDALASSTEDMAFM